MEIKGKRIRSLDRHVQAPVGTRLVPAVLAIERFGAELTKIGLAAAPAIGDSILPAIIGPRTRFNAEGGVRIHRDQPMETVTREIMWTWTQWRGRDRIERTEVRDYPYKRYPRTPIAPPAIELTVAESPIGERVIVASPLDYTKANAALLLHEINLLLEIFGECELLTPELAPLEATATKRLNWQVLPPGVMPWAKLQTQLNPLIKRMPKGNRPVALYRLSFLNEFEPEFTAVGRGGFGGYIIFGYPKKDVYLLESLYYGNATYVLGQDWKTLSQLTKAEILQGGLEKERLIHAAGWETRVRNWLAASPKSRSQPMRTRRGSGPRSRSPSNRQPRPTRWRR